jgi:hypothetical protein
MVFVLYVIVNSNLWLALDGVGGGQLVGVLRGVVLLK